MSDQLIDRSYCISHKFIMIRLVSRQRHALNHHENISCTQIGEDSVPIPVGSIAQLEKRRFGNPKMRVQIPLKTTNFSLFSALSV